MTGLVAIDWQRPGPQVPLVGVGMPYEGIAFVVSAEPLDERALRAHLLTWAFGSAGEVD